MLNFLIAIHLVLLFASMIFIGVIISEKGTDNSKYLFAATVSNFLVILGYTEEMLSKGESFSIISIKIQLLGLIFLITFLTFFIARCCSVTVPKTVRFAMLSFDMLLVIFALSAEYHSLYFRSIEFHEQDGLYPHMVVKPGIICCISLFYTIGQMVFIVICTVKDFKRKKVAATPTFLLNLCFLPATVAYFFFCFMTTEKMGFNPVPGSIVVGMSYLIYMVYRFRLLDPTQIAMESIIESINEVYFVVDVSKELLFASDSAFEVLPELNDRKKCDELVGEIYRNNNKMIEIQDRLYQVSVSPFYDKNTLKGYSLWLFDKTEEYENTQRLIDLKNQAEEASRAKTLFLANMSHEIRTPINAIMGTTEMILRSGEKREVLAMATDIKNSGELLSSIISGILDFSKIESGEVESVEINYDTASCIREVIKQITPKTQLKGLEFITEISETIPRGLRGDATQIRQILINLLDNACKYTQKGYVKLKIDWKEDEEDSKLAYLYFSVEDTGCGIKEKAIPSLFDSFQRFELRKHIDIQGTGLGLAIAKRLTESMGGEISVESVYGEGSVFSLFIRQKIWDPVPMGNQVLQKAEPEAVSEQDFVAPNARILCVDDNLTNRKVIKELLSIYRIPAEVASGGGECLEMLEKDSSYHLIFMDYMMPEMDGIETVKEIRKKFPGAKDIPIVALTADAVVGAKELLLENGFKDYIAKPIELSKLEEILLLYLPSSVIQFVGNKKRPGEYGKAIVLPGVDVRAGLSRYGGETGRYLQALKFLYDDGEKQIERMREMLSLGNYEGFGMEVHAIKGLMLGIGAERLSELAREEEMAVKEKRYADVTVQSDTLFSEYELLLANIMYVLKENGIETEETIVESGETLSAEELKELLNDALDALDLLDENGAEDILTRILKTKLKEGTREILIKALDEVKDFEYQKAQSRIEALL